MLAGLAGVGASFLVGVAARGVTMELWFVGVLVTDGPAPNYPQLLFPTFLAGSFVATRLGGWRAAGIVALYAIAAVAVVALRAFEGALQCALVPRACPPTLYLEALAGTAWIVPGLILGPLLARASPGSVPLERGLVAVSPFALGALAVTSLSLLARYTVCFSPNFLLQCRNEENALLFAWFIIQGALAAVWLTRLGGRARDALAPAAVLAAGVLPAPAHQLGMVWGDGVLDALAFSSPLLGALAYVLVALVLMRRGQKVKPGLHGLAHG